ncbi:MAG: hypothetical protein LBI08_00515 [Methanomassiliicoccaceae archaeon]|jgi:uncharacterized membrane protein|nr:hypothetical protein [Methanomassiliicoccaceae archaeon]
MSLERNTSFVLRYGSVIGVVIVAIGVIMHLLELSHNGTVMRAGIAVIILTPFAGMLVSFVTLSMGREKRYAAAAFALIAITVIGMAVAFWLE